MERVIKLDDATKKLLTDSNPKLQEVADELQYEDGFIGLRIKESSVLVHKQHTVRILGVLPANLVSELLMRLPSGEQSEEKVNARILNLIREEYAREPTEACPCCGK